MYYTEYKILAALSCIKIYSQTDRLHSLILLTVNIFINFRGVRLYSFCIIYNLDFSILLDVFPVSSLRSVSPFCVLIKVIPNSDITNMSVMPVLLPFFLVSRVSFGKHTLDLHNDLCNFRRVLLYIIRNIFPFFHSIH